MSLSRDECRDAQLLADSPGANNSDGTYDPQETVVDGTVITMGGLVRLVAMICSTPIPHSYH